MTVTVRIFSRWSVEDMERLGTGDKLDQTKETELHRAECDFVERNKGFFYLHA